MAIKFEFTNSVQLGVQFAQVAQRTGVLKEQCNSLETAADLLAENTAVNNEENRLPNQICDLFDAIFAEKRQIEFLTQSLVTVEEAVAPIFEEQKVFINNSLENIEMSALQLRSRVFGTELDAIKRLFDSAVEKLNKCRQDPTNENSKVAEKEVSNLAPRVYQMRSLTHRCFSTLESLVTKSELETYDQFHADTKRLEQLISEYTQETFGNLCARLKSACQKKPIPTELQEQLKAAFGQILEEKQLPSHLVDAIDGKIYELAPPPKGGKDWGKLHRFDDLNRFKKAFFAVLGEDFKMNLKKQIPEDELPEFYNFLLQLTFGPRDTEPETWVQSEFPAFVRSVDAFAQRFLKEREERVSKKWEEEFVSSSEEDENGFNIPSFEKSSVTEDDLKQQSLIDSFISAQDNTRIKSIKTLRSLIAELDQAAYETSSPIDKKIVTNLIKENLEADLCHSLFSQIYFLAEDKQPGVSNWGEVHCADDLPRLYRALDNLKLSVAFS
jgi:hypothetical protein